MAGLIDEVSALRAGAEALRDAVSEAQDTITEAEARAVHSLVRETIGWLLGVNELLEVG